MRPSPVLLCVFVFLLACTADPPSDGVVANEGTVVDGGSTGNAWTTPGATTGGPTGTTSFGGEITISGRQVLVDGEPIHLRGVCWNPVDIGDVHPAGLDFAGFAAQDIPLMQAAGINVVRTYEPLTDVAVLDQLAAAEIYVLNTVYPWGGAPASAAADVVVQVRNHPAILMWVIGNEWNYNNFYAGLSESQSKQRVSEVAQAIRAVDTTHPIATSYGALPSSTVLAEVPEVDVWGINIYSGRSFWGLFDEWAARSDKPMFLAEYGADAWNAGAGFEDLGAQATGVLELTQEIEGASAANGGVALGGTVFEWADEWWKDGAGSPNSHDVGGSAPGGGPFPDYVFNEEWWGIVDIHRDPRPAYDVLKDLFAGSG